MRKVCYSSQILFFYLVIEVFCPVKAGFSSGRLCEFAVRADFFLLTILPLLMLTLSIL